ncbi:TonB-dependent receptor [Sporocytophaga myxococcoides]|uniref:TonB-dependent receptor n=1 Tax=Sporocytophaga myxococcoides TaxID=153721 RepID=UPI00048E54B6|nr:carboxypeptidase-like regulatory domain-containing protein [Sporocytophaga myxococcoides]
MRLIFSLIMALLCLNFSVIAQQVTQTIRGTVIDKNLQSPLPGVNVVITSTNPPMGTATDENGRFRFDNVPLGRHEIKIMYAGYKEGGSANVLVTSGKEVILNMDMEEEIENVKEVVVVGQKDKSQANNQLAVVSATNLRTEEINRFAGSRQDPSRMASNYAGVAGGGDQRNDIIVRGNSPIGVLWRLEGVDIPNPNHFTFTGNSGGAFSILNNNLLANSDFLTGAFPAEYGNKSAAVFDVKLRNGNNEKREHTIQAGLNGLEFVTEGPISKKSGSSYLASYRLLSFEALNKIGVNFGVNGIPQFQDAALKINIPTKKAGTFTLWGIGGKSKIYIKDPELEIDPGDPYKFTTDNFSSDMYAAGISNAHNITPKTTGKIILSTSGSRIKVVSSKIYDIKPEFFEFDMSNTEGQYIANYTVTHKLSRRNLVKGGVIYRSIFYNNNSNYFDDTDSLFKQGLKQKGSTELFQSFAHWQFRVTEKLTLNSGVYYQRLTLNGTQSLEPRLAATYMVTEKDRISIATGLHSQAQNLFIYQYRFYDDKTGNYNQPNKNVGFTKSLHLVGGYQRALTKNLKFKTEAYYQHMYNVPVSISHEDGAGVYSILNTGADYGFYVLDSTVNTGKGRNYGLELTLERYFNKDYYFLTNLSLLKSEYQGSDGVWRNSAFNIGYVVNALAGKEFHLDANNKKLISVDFKVTSSGGRRIIPIDAQASIQKGEAVYDYSRAYETQLKDYFRTDLKISYRLNKAKSNHNFFIAADNLLNTQNVLTQEWDEKKKEVETYYQLGLFPYMGYKVQF